MPLSQQKFGIEIECFNVSHDILSHIHRTFPGWSEHGDGSIHGRNQSGRFSTEIISPPLPATNASFRQVKEVMRYLRAQGVRINRSCGQHIHIDVKTDINNGTVVSGLLFKHLVERYTLLESQIDLMVPPSRRGTANGYCMSFTQNSDYEREAFNALFAKTGTDFTHVFRDGYRGNVFSGITRTRKLNVTAFSRHGTVEIRHGGASLNATKTIAWIRFCLAFVNTAKRLSLANVNERLVLDPEQYANLFYGMTTRRHVTFLQARMAAALAPATSPTTTEVEAPQEAPEPYYAEPDDGYEIEQERLANTESDYDDYADSYYDDGLY